MSEARSCAPEAPPRVCVVAEPDFGHVVEVGGAELIGGECAVAPDGSRGGRVQVVTRDRQRSERRRGVPTRRGRATLVAVSAEGKLDMDKLRCDQAPIDP